jgi:Ribbon-helix-helix protein, copG family
MPRTKLPKGSVPVTFRIPREIQQRLLDKARREEMSFSELIRRALLREFETAQIPGSPKRNPAVKRGRRK